MQAPQKTKPRYKDLWIPMPDAQLGAVDRGNYAADLEFDIRLRWLGLAGIELSIDDQILAVDPFFTRIPFWQLWLGRPVSDRALAEKMLPYCEFILVSHAHYDRLMDVPDIAHRTGAIVYGSTNTCKILALYNIPEAQQHEITAGDSISFRMVDVEVLPAEHLPAGEANPGWVSSRSQIPLKIRQYRMDSCFNFLIETGGLRFLYCAGHPKTSVEADVLIAGSEGNSAYYKKLLEAVKPSVFFPVQSETPSLLSTKKPVDMAAFKKMIKDIFPSIHVLLPEALREYIFSLERSHAFGRMLHIE